MMKAKPDGAKARLWAERIAAFERSDLSRRAWCAQNGVNKNTLDYWRKRLSAPAVLLSREAPVERDNTVAAAIPRVAPIVVAMQPQNDGLVAPIVIDLSHGVCVRAEVGTDAAWLSALVRGIAGC
jgi:hypothetical protein